MTAPEIFSSIRLIEALPDYFHYPKGGEELLRSMRGATILAIGGTDADGIEGGGLLIDYITQYCTLRTLPLQARTGGDS